MARNVEVPEVRLPFVPESPRVHVFGSPEAVAVTVLQDLRPDPLGGMMAPVETSPFVPTTTRPGDPELSGVRTRCSRSWGTVFVYGRFGGLTVISCENFVGNRDCRGGPGGIGKGRTLLRLGPTTLLPSYRVGVEGRSPSVV